MVARERKKRLMELQVLSIASLTDAKNPKKNLVSAKNTMSGTWRELSKAMAQSQSTMSKSFRCITGETNVKLPNLFVLNQVNLTEGFPILT
jgi:hypothetical protein